MCSLKQNVIRDGETKLHLLLDEASSQPHGVDYSDVERALEESSYSSFREYLLETAARIRGMLLAFFRENREQEGEGGYRHMSLLHHRAFAACKAIGRAKFGLSLCDEEAEFFTRPLGEWELDFPGVKDESGSAA
jgi:hypothetical protein